MTPTGWAELDDPEDLLEILDIVAGTDEPAFSVDQNCRITAWNVAATMLIGVDHKDATDQICHAVIRGRDCHGNRYCGKNCPVQRMARRGEQIHRFELIFQTAHRELIQTFVSVIRLPGSTPSKFNLVHLLNPAARPRSSQKSASFALPDRSNPKGFEGHFPGPPKPRLTRRELEVLGLLAAGKTTAEIGELLFVSQHTVRNHVQNLMDKLNTHTRLEAVSLAQRLRLI